MGYSISMWSYHADLLARPVPRSTSYPTAMEFGVAIGEAELGVAPDGLPYARTIAALFDRYRGDQPQQFSTAI